MDFGEKLRQLRQERQFNQPELAQQLGIEQSYLSKLENSKSLPSADVLQRLLNVFDLTLEAFLQGIDDKVIQEQLRAIPNIATHIRQRAAQDRRAFQHWLVGSMLNFSLGAALLIAGWATVIFPVTRNEYVSSEIVPKGAAGEVFGSISDYANYAAARLALDLLDTNAVLMPEQRDRIHLEQERITYQLSNLNTPSVLPEHADAGSSFTIDAVEPAELTALAAANISTRATRTYAIANSQQSYLLSPGWLFVPGGFLLTLGFVGFCLQNSIFRNPR